MTSWNFLCLVELLKLVIHSHALAAFESGSHLNIRLYIIALLTFGRPELKIVSYTKFCSTQILTFCTVRRLAPWFCHSFSWGLGEE